MGSCTFLSTPGFGVELSLKQLEKKLLNEMDKERYQTITSSMMYYSGDSL